MLIEGSFQGLYPIFLIRLMRGVMLLLILVFRILRFIIILGLISWMRIIRVKSYRIFKRLSLMKMNQRRLLYGGYQFIKLEMKRMRWIYCLLVIRIELLVRHLKMMLRLDLIAFLSFRLSQRNRGLI